VKAGIVLLEKCDLGRSVSKEDLEQVLLEDRPFSLIFDRLVSIDVAVQSFSDLGLTSELEQA